MRLTALKVLFFFTLASFAQPEEAFLHSKGYLVQGMSTLSLESNRTGWWRLSPAVAVKYGLFVSEGFDQRMDPIWSTRAAMEWWNDLYVQFEDTVLADDAFVNGPSHAQVLSFDAIQYIKWQRVFDEWRSREMDGLPNFEGRPLRITGSVYWSDLRIVLNLTTAEWEQFKRENPGIRKDHLTFNRDAEIRFVKLPSRSELNQWKAMAATKDSISVTELMASRNRISNDIPDPGTHERVLHRVRSGEYLGTIANKYHVGLSELKKWNDLRSDLIRVGQELVIYTEKGRVPEPQIVAVEETREGEVRSDEEDREEKKYRIKTGDTLWSIARDFPGVSADDIMRWNGIDEDIREGQEILILIPKVQVDD